MQNTLHVNPRSVSAHNLFAHKGFGVTAGNHTDAILSVLLGARTSTFTSLWLSSFFDWCRQPPGTGIPPRPGAPAHSSPTTGPSFKTLSEPRQNFLRGIGLHLGLGHVAFACAADTTKQATPGTCGCFFAAALLLQIQGQTNALDPTTTQKKGDGFG